MREIKATASRNPMAARYFQTGRGGRLSSFRRTRIPPIKTTPIPRIRNTGRYGPVSWLTIFIRTTYDPKKIADRIAGTRPFDLFTVFFSVSFLKETRITPVMTKPIPRNWTGVGHSFRRTIERPTETRAPAEVMVETTEREPTWKP